MADLLERLKAADRSPNVPSTYPRAPKTHYPTLVQPPILCRRPQATLDSWRNAGGPVGPAARVDAVAGRRRRRSWTPQ
jgi:hypothetical protein